VPKVLQLECKKPLCFDLTLLAKSMADDNASAVASLDQVGPPLTHCTLPVHEDDPPAEIYKVNGDDDWQINREGRLPSKEPLTFRGSYESVFTTALQPIDVTMVVSETGHYLTVDGVRIPNVDEFQLPHPFVNDDTAQPFMSADSLRAVRISCRVEAFGRVPEMVELHVHQTVTSDIRIPGDQDEILPLKKFQIEPYRFGDLSCKTLLLPYPCTTTAARKLAIVTTKEADRWEWMVAWRTLANTSTMVLQRYTAQSQLDQGGRPSRLRKFKVPVKPEKDNQTYEWGSGSDSAIAQLLNSINQITTAFKEERQTSTKEGLWTEFANVRIRLMIQGRIRALTLLDSMLLSRPTDSAVMDEYMPKYVVHFGKVKEWFGLDEPTRRSFRERVRNQVLTKKELKAIAEEANERSRLEANVINADDETTQAASAADAAAREAAEAEADRRAIEEAAADAAAAAQREAEEEEALARAMFYQTDDTDTPLDEMVSNMALEGDNPNLNQWPKSQSTGAVLGYFETEYSYNGKDEMSILTDHMFIQARELAKASVEYRIASDKLKVNLTADSLVGLAATDVYAGWDLEMRQLIDAIKDLNEVMFEPTAKSSNTQVRADPDHLKTILGYFGRANWNNGSTAAAVRGVWDSLKRVVRLGRSNNRRQSIANTSGYLTTSMNLANVPLIMSDLIKLLQTGTRLTKQEPPNKSVLDAAHAQSFLPATWPSSELTNDEIEAQDQAIAKAEEALKAYEEANYKYPIHFDVSEYGNFFTILGITKEEFIAELDSYKPSFDDKPFIPWLVGLRRRITDADREQYADRADLRYYGIANLGYLILEAVKEARRASTAPPLELTADSTSYEAIRALKTAINDNEQSSLERSDISWWALQAYAIMYQDEMLVWEAVPDGFPIELGRATYMGQPSPLSVNTTRILRRGAKLAKLTPSPAIIRRIATLPHADYGVFKGQSTTRTEVTDAFLEDAIAQRATTFSSWAPYAMGGLTFLATTYSILVQNDQVSSSYGQSKLLSQQTTTGVLTALNLAWSIWRGANRGAAITSTLASSAYGVYAAAEAAPDTALAARMAYSVATNRFNYDLMVASTETAFQMTKLLVSLSGGDERIREATLKLRGQPIKEAVAQLLYALRKAHASVKAKPAARLYFEDWYYVPRSFKIKRNPIAMTPSANIGAFLSIPPVAVRRQRDDAILQRGYIPPDALLGMSVDTFYGGALAMRELADSVWRYRLTTWSSSVQYAQELMMKRLITRVVTILRELANSHITYAVPTNDPFWQQVYAGNAARLILRHVPAAVHDTPTKPIKDAIDSFSSRLTKMEVLPPSTRLDLSSSEIQSLARMEPLSSRGPRLLLSANRNLLNDLAQLGGTTMEDIRASRPVSPRITTTVTATSLQVKPQLLAVPTPRFENTSWQRSVWAVRRVDGVRAAVDAVARGASSIIPDHLVDKMLEMGSGEAFFLQPFGSPMNLTPARGSIGDRNLETSRIIQRLQVDVTPPSGTKLFTTSGFFWSGTIIANDDSPRARMHDPYMLRVQMMVSGFLINATFLEVPIQPDLQLDDRNTSVDDRDDTLQQELWQVDRLLAAFCLARAMDQPRVLVTGSTNPRWVLWVALATELASIDGFVVTVYLSQPQPGANPLPDKTVWLNKLQQSPKVFPLIEVLACM
jgi:hypothetical protein